MLTSLPHRLATSLWLVAHLYLRDVFRAVGAPAGLMPGHYQRDRMGLLLCAPHAASLCPRCAPLVFRLCSAHIPLVFRLCFSSVFGLRDAARCAMVMHEIRPVHNLILNGEFTLRGCGTYPELVLLRSTAPSPPRQRLHRQAERCIMVSRQLELGFENQPGLRPASRRGGRSNRAHWWFDQMRGAVNSAPDWEPVTGPGHGPRPAASQAKAGSPSGGFAPRAVCSVPAAVVPKSRQSAKPFRWKFARSRRLLWE
jgi:hypothetical protein